MSSPLFSWTLQTDRWLVDATSDLFLSPTFRSSHHRTHIFHTFLALRYHWDGLKSLKTLSFSFLAIKFLRARHVAPASSPLPQDSIHKASSLFFKPPYLKPSFKPLCLKPLLQHKPWPQYFHLRTAFAPSLTTATPLAPVVSVVSGSRLKHPHLPAQVVENVQREVDDSISTGGGDEATSVPAAGVITTATSTRWSFRISIL
ncbi:hypothetical protein B0H19DRAFT_1262981 [Mycena capillaripes]|nr:hypothetical protein B0H19DRAFT_1262981 [Mycena capillaripes]